MCCDVWIYLLNVVFIDVNVSVFYLLFPQMNTFLKVQYKCVRICHKLTDGIQMDNHAFFFLCSSNEALQDTRGTKSQVVNQSPPPIGGRKKLKQHSVETIPTQLSMLALPWLAVVGN